jgi:hypothetical protein
MKPGRNNVKTKLSLMTVIVLLLGLVAHAHFQASKLQKDLDYQTADIRAMAVANAKADLLRGVASYILAGQVQSDYVYRLGLQLKPIGITPIGVGCFVTKAYSIYSDAYNRVVRESLTAQHGKDLIGDFDRSWSNRSQ